MHPWLRPFLLSISALFCLFFLRSQDVQAATTTICAASCDFVTLDAALSAPPAPGDTLLLSSGYTFSSPPENATIGLPNDITLTCDPDVTYGNDSGPSAYIYLGSNDLIHDCHFTNTSFDASGQSNVSWVRNTFSSSTQSQITLTNSTGFTISQNIGIQKVQNQNADNGTIDGNQFECRFGNNCLSLVTAGGGPFDYTNPADVPNDITISNNIFSNENVSTGGDFIHLFAGLDITFASNTIQSAVQVNDSFITMLTVENAHVDIHNNYFYFPERQIGDNSGIWALNIRVNEGEPVVDAGHNAFIVSSSPASALSGNACLGVFDNGFYPGPKTVSLNFHHNLCFNGTANSGGTGMALNYIATSSVINLTEQYNGFYNQNNILNDNTGTITTSSATNLTSNPVMRRENATSSDDFIPVPMSRYLDADGTEDIGPYNLSRISSYTIDQNCTVDYTTCMSHDSGIINSVIKSGDTVHVAAGTYPGLTIAGPLSNISLSGDGTTTIFDGSASSTNGLKLQQVTNASISDIRLINSTDTTITTYAISKPILHFGGNDYDDSSAFSAPPDSVFLIIDGVCNAILIQNDNTDITSAITGSNAINAFLIDAGPNHVTALAPNNVADDLPSFASACSILPSTIIQDVFTPNGDGTYSFNAAALSGAGASLASGMTNPARLDQDVVRGYRSGLQLDSASNNTFTAIDIRQNDLGISFVGTSTGNTVTDATFNSNAHDIVSNATGTNDLVDAVFNRTSSDIDNGTVRVFFHTNARVLNTNLFPIAGVNVSFVSDNGLTNTSSTTDLNGYTAPILSQAYAMTPSSIALTNGHYNPFTFTAAASGGYFTTSTQVTLQSSTTQQLIMLASTGGGGGGGGGGSSGAGSLTSVLGSGSYSPISTASTPMVISSRTHQLLKLADDGNPKTQEDSTVYYIGADGKRHAFPNPSVYTSWYCDFSAVQIVSKAELASFALGRNITYKPGVQLVKFRGAPTVFVVQPNHTLRALPDETTANNLFGNAWAKRVRDIEDTFYLDYTIGTPLETPVTQQDLEHITTYPSAEMGITGYQDLLLPGSPVPSVCGQPSKSNTDKQESATANTWPFKELPPGFNFTKDLSIDSPASAEIRYLQDFLSWKGNIIYPEARITGNFGPATQQAVKTYQKHYGIRQTGTLGPATRAAINAELNTLP